MCASFKQRLILAIAAVLLLAAVLPARAGGSYAITDIRLKLLPDYQGANVLRNETIGYAPLPYMSPVLTGVTAFQPEKLSSSGGGLRFNTPTVNAPGPIQALVQSPSMVSAIAGPVTSYMVPAPLQAFLNESLPTKFMIPFQFFPPSYSRVEMAPSDYRVMEMAKCDGGPFSDSQLLYCADYAFNRFADRILDVPSVTQKAKVVSDMQGILDSGSGVSDQAFGANLGELSKPTPNWAGLGLGGNKVGRVLNLMLVNFYVPLSILLLLPGAVMSSAQFLLRNVGLMTSLSADNPFIALARIMLAVFLIGGSSVIFSYSMDIGNVLADTIQKEANMAKIAAWGKSCTAQLNPANSGNDVTVPLDTKMSDSESLRGAVVNSASSALNSAIQILTAFQSVLSAYLYLLAPLACAFLVYPETSTNFFRRAFGTWVNAVVGLCSWKFLWAAVLVCMSARLEYVGKAGGDPQWEQYMHIAFLTILAICPVACFVFSPGQYVDVLLSKAKVAKVPILSTD